MVWRQLLRFAPNSLAALALTAGCCIAGWLTDRLGPGILLTVGCPLLGCHRLSDVHGWHVSSLADNVSLYLGWV